MDNASVRINNLIQHFNKKGFGNDSKWSFVVEKLIPSIVNNKCLLCNCRFYNEFSTKRHFFCKHEQLFPENMFEEFKRNKCEKCNINFYRKDKYSDHIEKHQAKETTTNGSTLNNFWEKQKSQIWIGKRQRESKMELDETIKSMPSSKRVRFASTVSYEEEQHVELTEDKTVNKSKKSLESDVIESDDIIILDDENDDIFKMNNEVEMKQELSNIKYKINQLKIRYNLIKEKLYKLEED